MISKPSLRAVPVAAFLTVCYQLNPCPSFAIGVDGASSGRLHTAAEFEFTCQKLLVLMFANQRAPFFNLSSAVCDPWACNQPVVCCPSSTASCKDPASMRRCCDRYLIQHKMGAFFPKLSAREGWVGHAPATNKLRPGRDGPLQCHRRCKCIIGCA